MGQEIWGNLIPADVFASWVAKVPPGSNFPKIPKLLASVGSARATVAQILGILGKFDPCRCFRISGFKIFGQS